MMLDIRRTTQFKKDLKKTIKQRKDLGLLEEITHQLRDSLTLKPKHCDHLLIGEWYGYREYHITPTYI